MLILNDDRFIETSFNNEEEIERVVFDNYEYLFGYSSFLLPKALIKTNDGAGTIPDGFVIDLSKKRWYVVEAETSKHSVWSHIAPQVSKQLIAAQQEITRKLIIELSVNQYTESKDVKDKFIEEGISEINLRKYLSEILETDPIVGIPIDKISKDLEEWAKTLKSIVKLWIIKKFVHFKNQTTIIYEFPEEYKPEFDTEINDNEQSSSKLLKTYDVTLEDLINSNLLSANDDLIMVYGFKSAEKKTYFAKINDDYSITVLNEKFDSPSYAALYCINDYGSARKTVNGWTSWKNKEGKTLSQLRDEYLKR
jgi:hypothetical protein